MEGVVGVMVTPKDLSVTPKEENKPPESRKPSQESW